MEGVEVEICGFFIYLHGDTRKYKELLKPLKFRWASKKKVWYWRPDWYSKRGGGEYSMTDIRQTYGSTYVSKGNEAKKEEAKKCLILFFSA